MGNKYPLLEWIELVLHRCWSLRVNGFHFVVSVIVSSECLLQLGQHVEKHELKDGLLVFGKKTPRSYLFVK